MPGGAPSGLPALWWAAPLILSASQKGDASGSIVRVDGSRIVMLLVGGIALEGMYRDTVAS